MTDAAWWDRALSAEDDVHGHVRHDEAGHAVYLHDSDEELLDRLEAYVVDGWHHGQRTVMFAEPARTTALSARLDARGMAQAVEAYDASAALQEFMHDGVPQAPQFTALVNQTLVQQGHGSIRLYGEMVSLLWRDGEVAAALDLERLWNGYLAAHPMPLLCAYPADLRTHPEVTAVCRAHAHVFPAA